MVAFEVGSSNLTRLFVLFIALVAISEVICNFLSSNQSEAKRRSEGCNDRVNKLAKFELKCGVKYYPYF